MKKVSFLTTLAYLAGFLLVLVALQASTNQHAQAELLAICADDGCDEADKTGTCPRTGGCKPTANCGCKTVPGSNAQDCYCHASSDDGPGGPPSP